jgi:6-phosphogluconolactonase
MKRLLFLALAAALVAGAPGSAADGPAADSYWVYFGTYTGGKGGSKGIHRAKFDAKTGKLSDVAVAAEMGSPSFVTVHPNGKFLYAVGEGQGKEGGAVVAFALNAKTGELTKLNEDKSGGPGPCHIVVSPKGTHAAVANYGGGSTALFTLGEDGKLIKRVGFVQHKGSSVNAGRQKEPHAHNCTFDPTGEYVATVDLGIDKIKFFKVDAEKGLVESEKLDIVAPAGSGPRHLAINVKGKAAYVCGELDSTVNTIVDHKVVQSLSTLPQPTPGNSTAECILSPDAKFVYVSNRGHNSIAVFKIGEDNKLTAAGHITGDIKIPRNFNIDPSGKWMLIASQDGHKVGVWEIDAKTGGAKETGSTVEVGSPVCIKLVPIAK